MAYGNIQFKTDTLKRFREMKDKYDKTSVLGDTNNDQFMRLLMEAWEKWRKKQ